MGGPAETASFAYDAFISYSRKNRAFAGKLESALESYKPPKGIGGPSRRLVLFRDEADFVGTDYHTAVHQHLGHSSKLLVVCSPEARRSEYVNEEIRVFAEARGAEHIVPVLLSGIPNNEAKPGREAELAFPEALCRALEMPLAANYAGFDPQHDKLQSGRFSTGWYTVLANLYGVSRGDIEQREAHRRARSLRLTLALLVSLVVVLSTLAGWAMVERRRESIQRGIAEQKSRLAIEERGKAEQQKRAAIAEGRRAEEAKGVALDLQEKLMYDVLGPNGKFRSSTEARAEVARNLAHDMEGLRKVVPQDAQVLRELATAYRLWAGILSEQHEYVAACEKYRESAALDDALLAKQPDHAVYNRDLAVSHYNAGLMLANTGDDAGARQEFEAAVRPARKAKVAIRGSEWEGTQVDSSVAGVWQDLQKALARREQRLGRNDR